MQAEGEVRERRTAAGIENSLEDHPSKPRSRSMRIRGVSFSVGSSLSRRLETLAAVTFSIYLFVPVLIFCWIAAFFYVLFPLTTIPMWIYLLRIWWSKSPTSAPLPADGKYVIGYHPHGIISVGAFSAFCTEGIRTIDLTENDETDKEEKSTRGWRSLFPGVDRRLVTLPMNFYVPFLREYFLSLGLLNSSRHSFHNVLSKPGNAVAVVVGGADEAQLSEPHTMRLVLNKRKGFVREALIAGAALVPTMAFGENDLYAVMNFPEGHIVQRLQSFVLRKFGFSVPLFRGRSIFCYDFGFLPTRHPVTIVVGAPIPLPAVDASSFHPKWNKSGAPDNKDAEIVDYWHGRYLDELRLLSKQYKGAVWNEPGQAMLTRQQSLQIAK